MAGQEHIWVRYRSTDDVRMARSMSVTWSETDDVVKVQALGTPSEGTLSFPTACSLHMTSMLPTCPARSTLTQAVHSLHAHMQ